MKGIRIFMMLVFVCMIYNISFGFRKHTINKTENQLDIRKHTINKTENQLGIRKHTINKTENQLDICIISAFRPVSYLQQQLSLLQTQVTNHQIKGWVIDIDNIIVENISLPHNFVKKPLYNRITQSCVLEEGEKEIPNCKVVQETLDYAASLSMCSKGWTLILEDDMYPCHGAVDTIIKYIQTKPQIKCAQFARYSRAVLFPPNTNFSTFLIHNAKSQPVDILLNMAWADGTQYIHKESLFSHAGMISTHRYRNDPTWQSTYASWRNEECGQELH